MADEEGDQNTAGFVTRMEYGNDNHTGSDHEDSMRDDASVSFPLQADQGYQASPTDNDAFFKPDEMGRLDEGSIISALPETVDSSSLDYGWEIEQRVPRQSTPQKLASFLVFDMRGRKNFVEGDHFRLPVDPKQAIRTLKASLSDIHRTSRIVGGSQVLILGKDNDKYLLVKTASSTRCMSFKKASPVKTVAEGLNKIRGFAAEKHLHEDMDETYLRFLATGRSRTKKLESTPVGDDSFSVLYNKKPIEISEVLELPNFAMVEIVEVVVVEWHIFDRYKPLCDVRYIVKSSTMDNLSDIKRKFVDCYSEVQERGKMSLETVWLTQESTLLSDILVKGTYNIIASYRRDTEEMFRQCKTGSVLRLKRNPCDKSICIDEVYVHFPRMPKDALEIEVNFKEHVSYCSLLVISPEISRDELRAEVSKVVQQKPNSIRISVGGHKLDSKINLMEEICSPGCKIAVTRKRKISLHVHLVFVPPQPGEEGDCNIVLSVFSYDMMHMLKDELYNQAGILGHTVDLYFDERKVEDDTTFSDNRIRDKDQVEARVFPNRFKLLAWMPNKQWYPLLVDNCFSFTVGQVKTFAQSRQEIGSIHSCELTVIVRDRVVSDTELLGDLFPERWPLPRLVMVQVESMCFTADTAHKRTFAVCRSTESTWFQHVLAMFNDESVFYGAEVAPKDDKVSEMLEKRRHDSRPAVQVPGIRIVPGHQKQDSTAVQSPAPPTRGSSSPALFAQGASASELQSPVGSMRHSLSLQEVTPLEKLGGRQKKEGLKRRSGRPNCVQFCVGSSTSDFDSQDERKSSTRTLTLSELPTEVLEKTTEEENSDRDTVTDEAGDDTELRGRQRDRSPELDGTVSKIRSKSCPSLPTDSAVSQVNPNTRLQRSDSASAIMTRVTTIIDTICKNDDGTVTLKQRKDLEARGTPETLRKFLQDQSQNQPIPPAVPGASQAMVTYLQNQTCQAVSFKDPAFKYVKEKVVLEIARQLGQEGLIVIRELGVTQDMINRAKAEHPTDIMEKHLALLRAWCMRAGCEASKDVLKKALEFGGRRDLAERIDEMDPEPSQAESTKSKAVFRGLNPAQRPDVPPS